MDRRPGPTPARRRLSGVLLPARRRLAVAVLCVCLAGCGGHSYVQVGSSGSPSSGVSSGGSVNVQGRLSAGTLLMLGIFAGASLHAEHAAPPAQRVPELDPARRVAEQDCTKPIEDRSANLRCR